MGARGRSSVASEVGISRAGPHCRRANGLAKDELQVIRAGSVPTTPIVDSPAAAMARVLVGAPDKLLRVQEVTVAPGQDLGQWFSHEGEEFVYLVRGSILIELVGGASSELSAGDSAWYDSSIGHRWQLAGDEPAQLIAISAVVSRTLPHSAGAVNTPR